MKTEIAMRYHLPTEIATVKKTNKDVGKPKPLYIADVTVKWYNHFGKQFGSFLRC